MIKGEDHATDTNLADTEGKPPHFPNRYHSRIIENPHAAKSYLDHEAKFGTPLLTCSDEIVVFRGRAINPQYLIVFTTSGT